MHGLTRNGRDFDILASRLAREGFRVISVDMPGRGLSEWLPDKSGYDYRPYAKDCIALLEHLGVKICTWIGTSMGGIIGMAVNAMNPGLIGALVMNDIGAFIPAESLQKISGYVSTQVHFKTYAEYDKAFRRHMGEFGITSEEHWQMVLENSARRNKDESYDLLYDPLAGHVIRAENGDVKQLEDVDLWYLWNRVKCPALIIRGQNSIMLTRQTVYDMRKKHSQCDFIEFPNCGHAPALMDIQQVEQVCKWVDNSAHFAGAAQNLAFKAIKSLITRVIVKKL